MSVALSGRTATAETIYGGPCWSATVVITLIKAAELGLLLALASILMAITRATWPGAWTDGVTAAATTLVVILSSIVAFEALRLSGAYRWRRLTTGHGQWRRTAFAAGLSASVAMAGLVTLAAPFAATVALGGMTLVATSITLSVGRATTTWALRDWLAEGRFAAKIGVVGAGPAAAALAERLATVPGALTQLAGCYESEAAGEVWLRGNLDTLQLDCKLRRLDIVVFADSWIHAGPLVQRLAAHAQDFYTLPDPIHGAGDGVGARLAGEPLVLLWERPLKNWQGVRKQVFDRLAAAVILVVVAPLLLLVAISIRLESPGAVLFRQYRVGYNNQLFSILKFRSMRADATDRLAAQQTTKGDTRVTRVGAIIRKLSIDELPQLINVLRGDMSLVGPRPHAPGTSAEGKPVQALLPHYGRRHLVRPGITGLAQVRGFRGSMHTAKQVADRLQADLEYIRRQTLRLDLKIMLMTLVREVVSRRAF